MKYIFLFCFLCVWGVKWTSANRTSGSILQGANTVLSSVADIVEEGVSAVPGLGKLVFGDCVEPPKTCPNVNITFWYYSKSAHPEGKKISESDDSYKILPRNSRDPWKVIIHGYTKSKNEIPNPELRSAYFKRGNYNLISVDYSPLARSKCYIQAVHNAPLIAECTARFLDKLMDEQYFRSDNLHIIGFSLGAQIAGLIHEYLKHDKPYRVTGLDPASPLFDGVINEKLNKNSGQFVDVIHTNALVKGQLSASGHVDFYVNGGSMQPGCKRTRGESYSTCNHDRSPIYFAESINSEHGFWGIPCSHYIDFLAGACNTDESHLVKMGEDVPLEAKGKYFLQTTNKPPFALGKAVSAEVI